jgi:hypothetical protein
LLVLAALLLAGAVVSYVRDARYGDALLRSPPRHTIVSYEHVYGPAFYHATFSDLDGAPRCTWTVSDAGGWRDFDVPLTAARFRKVIAGLDLVSRYEVKGPGRTIDVHRFHFVDVVTISEDGLPELRGFLVPDPPPSPEIERWLALLEVPRGR